MLYIINELSQRDVDNNSVFVLDREFYPPHLLWSRRLWNALVKESVVKKALRDRNNLSNSMLGNILVVIDEDNSCFLIYTLTVSKELQSKGYATQLLNEAAKAILELQDEGWYEDLIDIRLSVEKSNLSAKGLYDKCGFKEKNPNNQYMRRNKFYMQQSVVDLLENTKQRLNTSTKLPAYCGYKETSPEMLLNAYSAAREGARNDTILSSNSDINPEQVRERNKCEPSI